MKTEDAKELLQAHAGTEDPVILPRSVLDSLSVADVPSGTWIEVGNLGGPVVQLEWSGRLYAEDGMFKAEAGSNWYRKFWYGVLRRFRRRFTGEAHARWLGNI